MPAPGEGKMNYTDGEWTPYQLRSNNVSICVKTEGDLVAVEIASLNTLLGYDVVIANANLIAAAPDMYEALKGLMRDYSTNPNSDIFYAACLKAREALAKAEGK